MFNISLYKKSMNNFLSETIRLRALIFGMKHHLVNLYQICSNYIPGAKNGRPGGHVLHRPMFYIRKHMKNSSCLNPKGLEP